LKTFRVVFSAMLFVAVATSLFAGLWLVGYSASRTSEASATTSVVTSAASTATTTSASESSTATTETATVSTTTMTTTASGSSTTETTTSTTTTVTATTTVSTTTVTGSATTVTTTTQEQGRFGSASGSSILSSISASFQGESLLREVQTSSLLLAPVCWIVLGGMWVWRGRVRARYSEMGFGSDVFELFMKMKGGATRIKVLNTLTTPKDRLQLAEELGVDWKTVDRHVQILNKYGFVREQAAYGTVRLYEVTPIGKMLLNLFDDLERTDGPTAHALPASHEERPSVHEPTDGTKDF
jgi:hypothetical protein